MFRFNIFFDIKSILKKEFCLRKAISLLSDVKENLKNENTASIHIHRGAFVKLFRDISRSDYYVRALQRVEALVKEPVYMIFSDDVKWVKENISIKKKILY